MNGRDLALGVVGGLALTGIVQNRGSFAKKAGFKGIRVPASFTHSPLPFVRGYAMEEIVDPDGRGNVDADTGLFHVTANWPAVQADRDVEHPLGRLRSRRELRGSGRPGVGLGGGGRDAAPDLVSVGIRLDGAKRVFRGMKLMARAVHGAIEPAAALVEMKALTSETRAILESAMDWMSDTDDEDSDAFQAAHAFELALKSDERSVLTAWKRVESRIHGPPGNRGHVLYESLVGYEETLVHALADWISNGWISDDEQTCSAPVGFTEPAAKFAAVRPENVALLRLAARRGARVDFVSSECELRLRPADLRVTGRWEGEVDE